MNDFTTSGLFDLVICDIDGCLAPETADPLNIAALAKVAEHNRLAHEMRDRPRITLCSGRPQPFVEAMSRLLVNRVAPAIAENGVWLYDPRYNLFDRDPAITPAQLAMVHAAERLVEERYAGGGFQLQPGKSASVCIYHPQPERLQEIMPELRVAFAERGWDFRVSMSWFYINCDLSHVSKATGIERLLALTGLDPARVAAIGDTAGDLAMRERVGWFGCPSNAQDVIKEKSDYISPHEEVDGVIDILREISAISAAAL